MIKKISLIALLLVWFGLPLNAQPNQKAEISDSIDVLHYDIRLDMVHLATQRIAGYAELQIVAKLPLTSFRLWLQQLEVDSVFIDGTAAASVTYNDTLITIDNNRVAIHNKI